MRLASPLRTGLPCLLLLVAASLAAAEPLPTLVETWGTFGTAPGQFSYPGGVCVEGNDYVYVADEGNNRIQKFKSDGTFVMQWGQEGSGPGDLLNPARIHLAANGELYVTDHQNHRVVRYTRNGVFLGIFGDSGVGRVTHPVGISTDAAGNIYVAGATTNRVHKYAPPNGSFLFSWGSFTMPYGCHVGPDGLVYVGEYFGNRVQVFTTNGTPVFSFGTAGSGPGQFFAAEAIEVDGDGNLYVADTGNDRVQKFTSGGTYLGEFAVPHSNEAEGRPIPCDLAISPDGYLYVVGFGSARLYKYRLPGVHNRAPDCSHATATIAREWPLNHRLVPVTISGITDPDGDPVTVRVTAITQDEPLTGQGRGRHDDPHRRTYDIGDETVSPEPDGDTGTIVDGEDPDQETEAFRDRCPDGEIDASGRAKVRLEALRRREGGNGRVYRLTFEASDGHGSCTGTVDVCVPLHRNGDCLDDGQTVNSLRPCPRNADSGEPVGELRSSSVEPGGELRLGAVERSGDQITLEYQLPATSEVQIGVFDIAGRRVAVLEGGVRNQGTHRVEWNATGFGRGVYFLQIRSSASAQRRTLILR